MSPSALTSPQNTSELTIAGIVHTIEHTAPSITANGTSTLQELDASKMIFIRNHNPGPVPEPNSPEVWAQNVYVSFPLSAFHLIIS